MTESTPPTIRPNKALILSRERAGFTRLAFARHLARVSAGQVSADAAYQTIKRIETGRTRTPGLLYQQLICSALQETPTALFGQDLHGTVDTTTFTVVCRKYIPVIVPPEVARLIAAEPESNAVDIDGIEAHRQALVWPHDSDVDLLLTIFPFGALVFELRQTIAFASLAELAVWRNRTYEIDRPNVADLLHATWPDISAAPEYVLGTWWLTRPSWSGEDLDTAIRIMSTPSMLLNRQEALSEEQLLAAAEVAEQAAFKNGFAARDDLTDFGVSGVSVGYATWSGVAYAPVAADRALQPDELGEFEVLCQGLWALCSAVHSAIEEGHDPDIAPGYGWRWLRGVASRITRPRPMETRQVRSMRDAVVSTSKLGAMLPEAIEIMKDAERN